MLEALLLNLLILYPAAQVVSLALVQFYFSASVAMNKPYVLIAQSRAEFWTAIGRALTFLIAFAAFQGTGGGVGSLVQSVMAAGAALGAKASGSKDVAKLKKEVMVSSDGRWKAGVGTNLALDGDAAAPAG